MDQGLAVFWFRRDLRSTDNAGFFKALEKNASVIPLFIFDTDILDKIENEEDGRVTFIHKQLLELNKIFQKHHSSFVIKIGRPLDIFKELTLTYPIDAVYTNHDYEPYAIKRDKEISQFLKEKNINFESYKDQVIFEKGEVAGLSNRPYKVFTAYKNKWLSQFHLTKIPLYPSQQLLHKLQNLPSIEIPTLKEIGFKATSLELPSNQLIESEIARYLETRDFPYMNATSRLGIHLRFGTVSIREMVVTAQRLSETWLSELIWREFFMQVLYHFPYVVDSSFQQKFNNMQWRNNEGEFTLWCEGKTGYPLVDAGMREMNATGFMHNRARLVTASFLTKHLLIDWKWGENYFASKLLDYELASNNGNWQWCAGTGVDAQPFFRIFNPVIQQKKFDPKFEYIKKWVAEWGTNQYPQPLVEHTFAVERAKNTFALLRNEIN